MDVPIPPLQLHASAATSGNLRAGSRFLIRVSDALSRASGRSRAKSDVFCRRGVTDSVTSRAVADWQQRRAAGMLRALSGARSHRLAV